MINRIMASGNTFPSPCGVSFILMKRYRNYLEKFNRMVSFRLLTELYSFLFIIPQYINTVGSDMFPSPYGVSFIIIKYVWKTIRNLYNSRFRLLTELYSFLLKRM